MIIRFSAPSKTFLSGEYAVLSGGPALILNTSPRFSFTATKGEHGVSGIPTGSPAAEWIRQRSPLLADWKLEFSDPHMGKGGFGASSAQFLFVHALTSLLQISVSRAVEGLDLEALRQDFIVLSGGQASGADLLAQTVGQVAMVSENGAQSKPWPYPELSFAVLRTGNKIQTHQHLLELDREPLSELKGLAYAVAESFAAEPCEKFLEALGAFSMTLRKLHLQVPSTLTILQRLEGQAWCKLAKGCGALGADTVLVFFGKNDRAAAMNLSSELGLEVVAGNDDLSGGLQMDWNWGAQ